MNTRRMQCLCGPLRLLAFATALLALAASPAVAQQAKFDPARDAAADVAHAIAEAKTSGRNVLVDVGGEWCVWCHILDDFFAADDEARTLRDAGYVVVKVNWSPANHNEALLARWPKVPGYPHLFVLDAGGGLVHSQPTDALEHGRGYDRDKVIAFLRRYAPRDRAGDAPPERRSALEPLLRLWLPRGRLLAAA